MQAGRLSWDWGLGAYVNREEEKLAETKKRLQKLFAVSQQGRAGLGQHLQQSGPSFRARLLPQGCRAGPPVRLPPLSNRRNTDTICCCFHLMDLPPTLQAYWTGGCHSRLPNVQAGRGEAGRLKPRPESQTSAANRHESPDSHARGCRHHPP